VDFGYSHAFVKSGTIHQVTVVNTPGPPPGPFAMPLVAKSKASIDVVSLGFRYKFGGDASSPMPENTKPN
jgi:long-subunit fatty acid transport protein